MNMGTRMSDDAWKLAQERRASRFERTATRRTARNGKRAERAAADIAFRATLGGAR